MPKELPENWRNEVAARIGLEIAKAKEGNFDADFVIPYVEELLSSLKNQIREEIRGFLPENFEKRLESENRYHNSYNDGAVDLGEKILSLPILKEEE